MQFRAMREDVIGSGMMITLIKVLIVAMVVDMSMGSFYSS